MKRPVLIVMSILAALDAVLALGTLGGLISATALAWVLIASVALKAGAQVWLQGQVTPLALPRAADGRPLVPLGAYGTDETAR